MVMPEPPGGGRRDRPDLALRPARIGDVSSVLELWATAAENAARPADSPQLIQALIERDPAALCLAYWGQGLIGSIIAGWDGWRYHLYRLAVHPDYRRLGVGQALLGWAEARLVRLGATRLDAMVLDGNELGQSIWIARGYQRQDDWSRWVKRLPD